MSSVDKEILLEARKKYLKSIKDPSLESGFLLEIIEKSVKLNPYLIVIYEENSLFLGVDNNQTQKKFRCLIDFTKNIGINYHQS